MADLTASELRCLRDELSRIRVTMEDNRAILRVLLWRATGRKAKRRAANRG